MSERQREGESARVGAFAARALEDIYTVVHGAGPVGVRTWCDGSSLLIVMRLADADDRDSRTGAGTRLYSAFAPLLATAVQVRTGWELAGGAISVERELGLVIFVFHLPADPPADGLERRGQHREAVHVPSWRTWTPVPSGGVASRGRRRARVPGD